MNLREVTAQLGRRSSWSASRALYVCIALGFIGLYLVAGGAQSRVSRLPADLRLSPQDFPASFGEHRVSSEAELAARVSGEAVGSRILLRAEDGSVIASFLTEREYSPFHTLVVRINGLFFLAVSLIVFAPRIEKLPARDLFWGSTLYGLAVMIGGIYMPQGALWPGILLPFLRILSLVLLPILLLNVSLTFPRRLALLDRHPRLMPAIVVVGLGIAAWQILVWSRWLVGSSPDAWSAIAPARKASGIFLAAVFGSGCVALVRSSRSAEQEREREQAKWLLWGIAMGSVPYIFFHALPVSMGMRALLPVEGARLFSVVIPIAFSFEVICYKFLDVDIITRRSILYVLLSSLLVGVYVVLGIFIGHRIEERWPASGPFVPIVATLVSVLLFNPTRRAIGTLIDRVFFKIRYDYARSRAFFRERLAKTSDQQAIARLLARFLQHNLGPTRIAVELRHGELSFEAGEIIPLGGSFPSDSLTLALPETTARPGIESQQFPQVWEQAGFSLAQRLSHEGDEFGLVLLGPKQTGRSFVADDLDLLAAATLDAARRVRRINLEQDFVGEAVARHQMEEMNRFRTQFFAQFAHDLRSPLTSINWGARNLLDGVVGEVNDSQRSYLEGIEASARQLVRLVNNLLEVTRFETGMPEVEFGPISVAEIIGESVSKLHATAAPKRVQIVSRLVELPAVWSHREKLLEVVDNLIENAIRYSPPDSVVEIDAAATDDLVELRIQDRGPGLEPEELETIFEPYRQGTPSPHSTQHGFGLGLFVVRSWIERMDGSVEASNRPGGGASFRIRIPRADAALGQQSEEST